MAVAAFAAALAATADTAHAADRWEPAGSGAVAILPAPDKAAGISGGSLVCAEQRWSFRLRLDGTVPAEGAIPATIAVGGEKFEIEASAAAGALTLRTVPEILDPLKAGSLMKITAGALEATFNLRNSKATLDAVAPLCSQVDMSAYTAVLLSETSPHLDVAREVRADEIKLFRSETGKQPVVSATMIEASPGKRLLFVSLCGSSYYGRSGCNLTGHVESIPQGWRVVYDTEGMLLYTDPAASTAGWPDLMTLPVQGGTEATRWVWTGTDYGVADAVAADEEPIEEQGDTGQ